MVAEASISNTLLDRPSVTWACGLASGTDGRDGRALPVDGIPKDAPKITGLLLFAEEADPKW